MEKRACEFLDPIQLYSKGTRTCNGVAPLPNVLPRREARMKKQFAKKKKKNRKMRKKKSPIDANYRRFAIISQTRSIQHDDVDHSWIVNHSWMTFTHARYAFTLKTPARARPFSEERRSTLCNERTPTHRVAFLGSDRREIEKHATFARCRGFDNGPILVEAEHGTFRGRVYSAMPPDAIRFLCASCEAHYYEQGVKYARDYERGEGR